MLTKEHNIEHIIMKCGNEVNLKRKTRRFSVGNSSKRNLKTVRMGIIAYVVISGSNKTIPISYSHIRL